MRLLDRLRPAVHITELIEFPVEREDFFLGPGFHDQLVRFAILDPRESGDLSVREVGVHGGADRKAGDEPTAGDAVEHGKLFGNPDRRIVQRDRVADDANCRLAGAPCEGRSDDIRARHQAVAVLVMFVAANPVETDRLSKLELVEVGIVDTICFFRIEQRIRDIYPHRAMFLFEVITKIGPRH